MSTKVNFFCLDVKRHDTFFNNEKWLVITDKSKDEVRNFYSCTHVVSNLYPTDKFCVKLQVENMKREVKFLF